MTYSSPEEEAWAGSEKEEMSVNQEKRNQSSIDILLK